MRSPSLYTVLIAGLTVSLCRWVVAAEPIGRVTFAESGIAIIRQTTFYSVAVGTAVQDGDIVETGHGGIQIEFSPTTLLSVAPRSRVLVLMKNRPSSGCGLLVYGLGGMIKFAQTSAVARTRICVQMAQIRSTLTLGSAIQRFDGSAVSVFAEKGDLSVQDIGPTGKSHSPLKVPAEQFAEWRSGQALTVLERPTPQFFRAVPASFQDELTPMADRLRDVRSEPVAQRDVSYSDIADWLKGMPRRAEFVRQFQPRLRDPEFRRQIDAELGKSAPWGSILHPPPPPDATQPAHGPAP
jgi:hypothetical protein